MAKMYYNLEEATAKLGCNEEQLRGLVRTGKLREFRDAGKLNYRVDEVDKLVAQTGDSAAGGSGELTLASDSGEQPVIKSAGSSFGIEEADAPIDLGGSDSGMAALKSDSGGSSGPGLVLSDSGAPAAKAPAPKAPESGKTGSGADILRLEEADREMGGPRKDDTVITNIGISVFDDDDLEIAADPRAKTMMTGADEHLGLDGSGGGSGLLDLTRESDDTSLGAELLEGIDMGDTAETVIPSGATATQTEPSAEEVVPEAELPAVSTGPMVIYGQMEPVSPAFTGLLAAASLVLALLGAAAVAAAMSAWPGYLGLLADQFWFTLGGAIVLGGICAAIGHFVGQPKAPRAPRAPKAPKPPKPAKAKK
jgi:hypothetical protein